MVNKIKCPFCDEIITKEDISRKICIHCSIHFPKNFSPDFSILQTKEKKIRNISVNDIRKILETFAEIKPKKCYYVYKDNFRDRSDKKESAIKLCMIPQKEKKLIIAFFEFGRLSDDNSYLVFTHKNIYWYNYKKSEFPGNFSLSYNELQEFNLKVKKIIEDHRGIFLSSPEKRMIMDLHDYSKLGSKVRFLLLALKSLYYSDYINNGLLGEYEIDIEFTAKKLKLEKKTIDSLIDYSKTLRKNYFRINQNEISGSYYPINSNEIKDIKSKIHRISKNKFFYISENKILFLIREMKDKIIYLYLLNEKEQIESILRKLK